MTDFGRGWHGGVRVARKWYVASVIYRCRVGDADPGPWTCDRQIRVIRATDETQAYVRAIELGKAGEHSYANSEQEIVTWDFVGLEDLDELVDKAIRDGTEIKSYLFTHPDPENLIKEPHNLTISWIQRNKHKTAQEIIDERGSEVEVEPGIG
jgi:hypothetical protein